MMQVDGNSKSLIATPTARVDAFVAKWRAMPGLAEQVLGLVLLDESLAQIKALAAEV